MTINRAHFLAASGVILSLWVISTPAAFAQNAGAPDGTSQATESKDTMGKDAMSHDATSRGAMSHDAMSKDAMSRDAMSKDAMSHDGAMGKGSDQTTR